MAQKTKPVIIAHRGASRELPENTIAAFELAIAQHAHMIECDLRFTADDQIVLVHDSILKLKGSIPTLLSRLSLATVRAARPNIPTLPELLVNFKGRAKLVLELKDPKFGDIRSIQKVMKILRTAEVTDDQVIFISFNKKRLVHVKSIAPRIQTGHITFWLFPSREDFIDIECVLFPILFLNPRFISIAQKQGKEVWAMDTTPMRRVKYYVRKNINGILTNHPNKTLAFLTEWA